MTEDAKRFGRRNLLVGMGVTAAVAPALGSCEPARAPLGGAAVVGPGKVNVALRVNGTERNVAVEPRQTLAEVLRVELGLTGTKIGCDRGACSACTVWLDGTPVCACTTFVLDAVGRAVTTIEGLAHGEALHPVQQAFIEHDAMQCGFCTPGMAMAAAALVERNADPTAEDVERAIGGHICRCGSYPHVVAATLAAAKARKG